MENNIWTRKAGASLCFATAFRLKQKSDLTSFAKTLPNGVVLCDAGIVAGLDHVEAILLQTLEYWTRDERLVRNGSIEILMRLSGKSQISEAIGASHIQSTDSVALLGLLSNGEDVLEAVNRFQTNFSTATLDSKLLELNRRKAKLLKKDHGLPASLPDKDLLVALQELSVLLIFSK